MKIETVAVLGAGAIGAYFIWGLSEKLGKNLWIIAEGDRAERLKSDGLMINQKNYRLQVKSPEEAKGADLLLIATKYGALRGLLPDIERVVTSNTVVMSLLNGVDSEEIIAEKIDRNQILYSFMKIASERRENQIFFDGSSTPGLFFGEADNPEVSKRMEALAELFRDTEIHFQMCSDIKREIWYKYALNISINLPQAIVGCGAGAYDSSEHMAFLSEQLRREVVEVAAAKGIDISKTDSKTIKRAKTTDHARYSTLQDLDAKRHTEIDMFSGTMIKEAKEVHIKVPYNEFAFHIIKAMEENNDGKLD